MSDRCDLVDRARAFACRAHRGQTRKGAGRAPYIVHLEEVARLVAEFGGDEVAIAAAWLHDTVEDCPEVTPEVIAARFGTEVAAVVAELTDDKSLPRAERKRLQRVHAPRRSARAALVKAADKISNVRAIATSPPVGWDTARRADYVDWASAVVAALPPLPEGVRAAFDDAVRMARASLAKP
ncbi:MAG: bifunctional (p)ppGpp synthetase/guanosine-3',5'-bis(diphosphate) 3'-pyrophosphohydrolase, partial [Alphaproteobacteria bacterium]